MRARRTLLMRLEDSGRGVAGSPPPEAGWFRCWLCRRVLPKKWTDEEARAEFARRFPGNELDERFTLCDDCNCITSESEGVDES